jgi:hypothetical protein
MDKLLQQIEQWYATSEVLINWLGGLSLLMFIGTLIAVPTVIIALPQDFLTRREKATGPLLLRFWYFPYLFVKNMVGITFILAGIAMLVLPGQGILTIFLGLILISFPRKRMLIKRIVGHRRVILGINKLRRRFNKPPLLLPGA